MLTVYVAQISGHGIVAFDAANEDEARARLADRTIGRDLVVFPKRRSSPLERRLGGPIAEAKPKEAEIWGQSIRAGDDKGRQAIRDPSGGTEGGSQRIPRERNSGRAKADIRPKGNGYRVIVVRRMAYCVNIAVRSDIIGPQRCQDQTDSIEEVGDEAVGPFAQSVLIKVDATSSP
jgi:hypothetical protein